MITLAIGQVFYSWASQDAAITGARRGIAPIARDEFGPLDFRNLTTFYLAALLIAVVCYLLCRWVGATPFGYALQGIRDSPERMQALGYRIGMYRIGAVTFVSFIASLGGIIMVFDRAQADPDLVSLGSTLDVLVVAVIGGIGSLGGAFIGALLLSLLDSFAQDLTDRYMTLTGVISVSRSCTSPRPGWQGGGSRSAPPYNGGCDGGTRPRTPNLHKIPTLHQRGPPTRRTPPSRKERSNDAQNQIQDDHRARGGPQPSRSPSPPAREDSPTVGRGHGRHR